MTKQDILAKLTASKGKILMLADGFIDEQWSIVGNRASLTEVSYIQRMNQFADRIKDSGSGGLGLELIKKRIVFGGFTANIGHAAAALGVDTTMAGLFGDGDVHHVFDGLKEIATMITLGPSSITHAFEFDDGKILMTDMESVLSMSWDRIVKKLGIQEITRLITEADIIGVGYWSLMTATDEIVENVCALLPQDGKVRKMFFDFADIRKRDEASLQRILDLMKTLNATAPMVLSVNEHEGAVLFGMFGETFDGAPDVFKTKTEKVRAALGIDELVIHTPFLAAVASEKLGTAYTPQTLVEKPVRTAGAGDTFNGGYLAGSLADLPLHERLLTANAAVTNFLKTGFPPSVAQIENVIAL